MKSCLILILIVMGLGSKTFGQQGAYFHIEATQGDQWFGSAETIKEDMRITVHPNHLDIELEWVIKTTGFPPAEHRDALEILGDINFQNKVTVVGMLVWYKDMVLKGKLKTRDLARRQYEEVVDRNVKIPPLPRDPVLLEKMGDNRYRMSIFPVSWGGTRKVRLRYLVPADATRLPFPHAFSRLSTISIMPGPGVKAFDLGLRNGSKVTYAAPVTLNPEEFELMGNEWSTAPMIEYILPSTGETTEGSRLYVGTFEGRHFSGRMAHAILRVPKELRDAVPTEAKTVVEYFATLKSGADSCRARVFIRDGVMDHGMRMFSANSIEPKLAWSLVWNGKTVKTTEEKAQVIHLEDGLQYARSFGLVPFYPMSATMPSSLAATLGFIDTAYALVALEQDAISDVLKQTYAASGVPTLGPDDIFPGKNESSAVDVEAWLKQRGWTREQLRQTISIQPGMRLPEGIRFEIRNGGIHIRIDRQSLKNPDAIRISIFDLKGQALKTWSPREFVSGSIDWSPSESRRAPGAYILKVGVGTQSFSQPFSIK